MSIFLIAVGSAIVVGEAQELVRTRAFFKGNELHRMCTSNALYEEGVCLGFVVGIADAISATGGQLAGFRSCFSGVGVEVGQIEDVVAAHLIAHPETRHLAAVGIVAEALAEAFPCQ